MVARKLWFEYKQKNKNMMFELTVLGPPAVLAERLKSYVRIAAWNPIDGVMIVEDFGVRIR